MKIMFLSIGLGCAIMASIAIALQLFKFIPHPYGLRFAAIGMWLCFFCSIIALIIINE